MLKQCVKELTAYEIVNNCKAVNIGRKLPNKNSDNRCPGCVCINACTRFIQEFGDIPFKFISQVYPSSPLTDRVFSNTIVMDKTVTLRELCATCRTQMSCDTCMYKSICDDFCTKIHLATIPCKLVDALYGKPFNMDEVYDK